MVLRASQQPFGSVGILSCYAVPLWAVRDFMSFSPSSPAGALPSVMIKSPPGYWVTPPTPGTSQGFPQRQEVFLGKLWEAQHQLHCSGIHQPYQVSLPLCRLLFVCPVRAWQRAGGALCRWVLYVQTPSESSFLPAAWTLWINTSICFKHLFASFMVHSSLLHELFFSLLTLVIDI